MRHAFLAGFAAVLLGCGGSDGAVAGEGDTGVVDSAHLDATGDTATGDTATGDTATSDTATGDTAKADTAGDAGPTDSAGDTGPSDGGGSDSGKTDGGTLTCGDKTCAAGELCTQTYTTGGACMACAGSSSCPTGRHCSGGCCVPDVVTYAYACKPIPSGCTKPLACGGTCGPAVCSGGCPCESATDLTVTCHCLAP